MNFNIHTASIKNIESAVNELNLAINGIAVIKYQPLAEISAFWIKYNTAIQISVLFSRQEDAYVIWVDSERTYTTESIMPFFDQLTNAIALAKDINILHQAHKSIKLLKTFTK